MNTDSRVFIAGHRGLVGSAILRRLEKAGYHNIITKTKNELDLRNAQEVERFFAEEQPEYVFLSAAKVGGIYANNTYPAEFIYDNLAIQLNVIHSSYIHKAKKLLFLGSSCIYPKHAPQPMKEEYLLSGYLEPTNEPYAIAKIAGIKLCEAYNRQYGTNFLSVMPTNIYGINDNFNLMNAHVVPALIHKFHLAKHNGEPHVELWGTGTPRREFLNADDLADACVFLMENFNADQLRGFVNIGTGVDITVAELADIIKDVVGYEGEVRFNPEKPDGTPRKLLDVTKMKDLGWTAKIPLREGLHMTYQWFEEQVLNGSGVRA